MKNIFLIALGAFVGYKIGESVSNKSNNNPPGEPNTDPSTWVESENVKLAKKINSLAKEIASPEDIKVLYAKASKMELKYLQDIFSYLQSYYYSEKKDIPVDLLYRLRLIRDVYGIFKSSENLN